ncbi:MAG: hypothetical protein CMJ67_04485 [Planctomycetaceae bacterium]|nr:hypothetical protein [Planctomycetaceae bacterium]
MRIPLTIAGLPELESLSSEERTELLQKCHAPSPLRLWTWNFTRGLFLTSIVLFFFHIGNRAQQLSSTTGVGLLLGGTLCLSWLMPVWTMSRIRGQIRFAIEAASRDGLVPICTRCGHDCGPTTSSRCPECGASRRISSPTAEESP